ncbi:SDR family oxidoreductase [Arthrobacter sp. SA17]
MILVTGATGNIGREAVALLQGHGQAVRAQSRNPSVADFPNGVEAVAGSTSEKDSMVTALRGVDGVLLNVFGDIGPVVESLREQPVSRVVLVSSICASTRTGLAYVEEFKEAERRVRECVPSATILRPGQFMSNTLWWKPQLPTGRISIPFADAALPAIAPEDIASVAVAALTGLGHDDKTYELSGPARISAREQAAIVESVLGQRISVESLGEEEFRDRSGRMDPKMVEYLVALNGSPNDHELRVLGTVKALTGRAPTTYAQWVQRHAGAFN